MLRLVDVGGILGHRSIPHVLFGCVLILVGVLGSHCFIYGQDWGVIVEQGTLLGFLLFVKYCRFSRAEPLRFSLLTMPNGRCFDSVDIGGCHGMRGKLGAISCLVIIFILLELLRFLHRFDWLLFFSIEVTCSRLLVESDPVFVKSSGLHIGVTVELEMRIRLSKESLSRDFSRRRWLEWHRNSALHSVFLWRLVDLLLTARWHGIIFLNGFLDFCGLESFPVGTGRRALCFHYAFVSW